MILGLGNDAIDIRRIENTLEKFGARFIERIFTREEQARSERRQGRARAASYAKRFAAKEACSKALGTGLRNGVYWRDMGVINLASGRPTLRLTGGAAEILAAMTPDGATARIDLTLTDDYPYAHAVVIISAVADKSDPR
jgi:holo-[acyl-carrier protein] synthase